MKKALVINYYGRDLKNPGGRRTLLWNRLLQDAGYDVELLQSTAQKRKGLVSKIFTRVCQYIYRKNSSEHVSFLESAREQLSHGLCYDIVVLCCPVYCTLELVEDITSNSELIIDIRDGVYHESLYSSLEKSRFKAQLKSYENNLSKADRLVFNLKGLQDYYCRDKNIPSYIIYNSKISPRIISFDTERNDSGKLSILYTGGLMRSSIGQNVFSMLKAINSFRKGDIEFNLVGRFNIIEKVIYRLLCNKVFFHGEVEPELLENFVRKSSLLLIVNTTSRDLLPSKFWQYAKSDIPILSIGTTASLDNVSKNLPGFYSIENDWRRILSFLDTFEFSTYDRSDFRVDDDFEKLCQDIRG